MKSEEPSDLALVEAYRAGDRQALVRLITRHEETIHRFGRALCRHDADALDVLQDTMVTLVEKLGDFRGNAAFTSWLYAIARSQCARKRRKGKREVLSDGDEVALDAMDPAPLPLESATDAQTREILYAAIDELDPMYRDVMLLRDVEGFTAPEVSETLGLSVDAVKSRLHRARASVRERIAPLERSVVRSTKPGCPDVVAQLSRHLEGELTGADCSSMEAHLETCPVCKDACDGLRRTLSMCALSGARPATPEARRAISDALEKVLATLPPKAP